MVEADIREVVIAHRATVDPAARRALPGRATAEAEAVAPGQPLAAVVVTRPAAEAEDMHPVVEAEDIPVVVADIQAITKPS